MKLKNVKINELYIWQDSNIITIDKVINVNNNFIQVKIIKSISGDYQTGEITNYGIDFFCRNWRELTPLEKVKYL